MINNFLNGQAIPLAIPQCARREWQKNGVAGSRLKKCEQEHKNEVGYEFAWGQLIEKVADPSDFALETADMGNGVRWPFRLNEMHTAFMETGRHLEDLCDASLFLLEQMAEKRRWPRYIDLWEGADDLSTFEMVVLGDRNIAQARKWIHMRFLRQWLPTLFSELRELNSLPRHLRR